MLQITSKISLSRQANAFLREHCVSKRNAEIMAFGFSGYLNGDERENLTLIRTNGVWMIFGNGETVLSMRGQVDCFSLTRNTII